MSLGGPPVYTNRPPGPSATVNRSSRTAPPTRQEYLTIVPTGSPGVSIQNPSAAGLVRIWSGLGAGVL